MPCTRPIQTSDSRATNEARDEGRRASRTRTSGTARFARFGFPALVAVLALSPAAAIAQRGGGAPPFDGPRGEYSFQLSDGEPVSFYLEFSRMLDLTEAQKSGLIEIRRKLRIANAPYMQKLDSIRQAAGVNMESRGRMGARDEEALQRFREWSAGVTDSIRVNNDGARREIRALLDDTQMARADSLNREIQEMRGRRQQGGRPRSRPDGASLLRMVRSG